MPLLLIWTTDRNWLRFSNFDDTGTPHASTSQPLSEATTELPVKSTTYYNPEPNQAISDFIKSVVTGHLPVHTQDEPLLALLPVKEMQEWLAIAIIWTHIWDVIWRAGVAVTLPVTKAVQPLSSY